MEIQQKSIHFVVGVEDGLQIMSSVVAKYWDITL